MKTLLACELRKILSRKVLWVVLALGVVMWVQVRGTGIVRERLSGSTQGVKDVIAQYEGQVLTEALQARMKESFESYVAAHGDRFIADPEPVGNDDSHWLPGEAATPYDQGVWVTYANLSGQMSLEDLRESQRMFQQMLTTGVDEQGMALSADTRRSLNDRVRFFAATPMVRYAKGWEEFFRAPNENGLWVLLATVVALLGLFGGETSAHMDAIVLTARNRRRAVAAKLLAGAIVSGGSAVLFFGLQFAAQAYAWGLQGAWLPASQVDIRYGSLPVAGVFALSVLALVLDAVACGAIVAWASARMRHVLLALLAAGAILGGMALLGMDSGTALQRQLRLLFSPYSPVLQMVDWFVYALPVNTLMENYPLAWNMSQAPTLILHLALPAGLAVMLSWLSSRAFLRRRRA